MSPPEPMMRPRLAPGAIVLAALLCAAPGVLASPVLGPGQSARVREAVGEPGELAAGWRLIGWRIEEDQVLITLEGPDGSRDVSLQGEAHPEQSPVKTSQGWLHADALPPEVRAALIERLSASSRVLEWRSARPQAPQPTSAWQPDPKRASAQLKSVLEMRSARAGQGTESPVISLDPSVGDALTLLLSGDRAAARARLESLGGGPSSWPPGGWSVWLAAGGVVPDVLVSAAETNPWEPRLHGLLAQRARREGRLQEAAWRLDIALKLPLADQLVFDEAAALGWPIGSVPGPILPRPAESAGRSSWPWLVGGLLTVIGLGVIAWRRRDHVLMVACLLGLSLWWGLPTAPQGVPPPELPQELTHPLAGGPCVATPAHHDGGGLRVTLTCEDARHALVISPRRPGWEAHGETRVHQISIVSDSEAPPEVVGAADALLRAVQAAEKGGFQVSILTDGPSGPAGGRPAWLALDAGSRAELAVVGGLVGAALLILLATLLGLGRSLLGAWRETETHRGWLLGALVLATLAHLLAPERMMMVYGGYDLATHIINGQVPRYGAGSVWFYGPPMWLLGSDHAWMQIMNRGAGLLCVIVAWDLGRKLWKDGALLSAWVLALLPVLWRGHTSESIVILPTLLVLLCMWHLAAGSAAHLGRAVLLGLAAATCRPEIALMVALVPLWWWAGTRERRPMAQGMGLLMAGAPLWGVQMWSVVVTAASMATEGALPALQTPKAILGAVLWVGILANPAFTPMGFVPLGIWGARAASVGRRALVTFLFALTWIASTGVDLTEVSVPRLHTGSVLLVAPLVGLGWACYVGWCASRRYLVIGAVCLWAVGLGWSGWQCFRPVNEDAEEALWRSAVSALPEDGGCLAAMGYGDMPPAGKTARHNPAYLLTERGAVWATYNLTDLQEMQARCDGPSYVLLGMRCYADLREPPRPQPLGNEPLKICAQARETPGLISIFERTVPNHGDLAYEMYPAGGPLTLGLYRLPGQSGVLP